MKKSEDEICAAKRLVTKTVEEVTRIAREHSSNRHSYQANRNQTTQEKNYVEKIENFRLFATELRGAVENGEWIVQRNISPEILQAGYAASGRCENF